MNPMYMALNSSRFWQREADGKSFPGLGELSERQ